MKIQLRAFGQRIDFPTAIEACGWLAAHKEDDATVWLPLGCACIQATFRELCEYAGEETKKSFGI